MSDPPLTEVADLCEQARTRLGTRGSFRLRTLLDMVLIELDQPTGEKPETDDTPAPPGKPPDP